MALARALRASQASAGGAATRDRGLRATAVTADPTTRSYVQKPALPGRWLAPQGYQLKAGSFSSDLSNSVRRDDATTMRTPPRTLLLKSEENVGALNG